MSRVEQWAFPPRLAVLDLTFDLILDWGHLPIWNTFLCATHSSWSRHPSYIWGDLLQNCLGAVYTWQQCNYGLIAPQRFPQLLLILIKQHSASTWVTCTEFKPGTGAEFSQTLDKTAPNNVLVIKNSIYIFLFVIIHWVAHTTGVDNWESSTVCLPWPVKLWLDSHPLDTMQMFSSSFRAAVIHVLENLSNLLTDTLYLSGIITLYIYLFCHKAQAQQPINSSIFYWP